jgi:anti-sigma factor RsiW
MMDAFIDGELAPTEQTTLTAHLDTCPTCPGELAARRAMLARLKSDLDRYTTPARFEARLLDSLPKEAIASQHPSRRHTWFANGAWASAGAALAAGIMLFVLAPAQQNALTEELVAAHVRSLMANHLTDVVSSDQHTVKPWFNGRVDLSPPVPDLSEQGYPLVGGRLDYIHDRTVAALVYRRHQHPINLFVWPDTGASEVDLHRQRNGYNVVFWRRDNVAYAIVSDVNGQDIAEFRRLWTTSAFGAPIE